PVASTYPSSPRTRWSPPEQNASVPAPVRMTTPISGSSRATSNAFDISTTVAGRKALRTSGRLIVILAMPSDVSYRMSSYSPEPFQVASGESLKSPLLERLLAPSRSYAASEPSPASPVLPHPWGRVPPQEWGGVHRYARWRGRLRGKSWTILA